MPNEKISQMPAATALTGAELIELVQGGVNVQSTVNGIASVVGTPFALFGNPGGPAGGPGTGLNNQFFYASAGVGQSSSGVLGGITNVDAGSGVWTFSGSVQTFQSSNGGGTTYGNSVPLSIANSSSASGSAAELIQSYFTPGGSNKIALMRLASSGLAIGGFTMTAYILFGTTLAGEQVFMGFCPGGALGGATVPSALLNSIGLGKDAADTGLQFMINNGAGTATKTALLNGGNPVTLASLSGHLLRLVITCDGAGNCAITLSDLETGGLQYTISYPTATAKLPAAYNSTNGQLAPHLHINNGATASAITFGTMAVFVTGGFGSA